MLLFFGTRNSKIKTKKLEESTKCPYCETQNSFTVTTFGRYFHLFWIPLFPLSRSTIVECNHCKKTYHEYELPEEIKRKLNKSNTLNPSKRPLWHGCGCLIIIAVVLSAMLLGILGRAFYKDNEKDLRKEYLKEDIKKTTSKPNLKNDSISVYIKTCLNSSLKGINIDKIKYYSKINETNLLVLLKVSDMKKIEKSSRKELVFAVEDCIDELFIENKYSKYIGIDGNWNMLMVKTPNKSNLKGKFANKNLLLPFYGSSPIIVKDTLTNKP